jgi:hypothetical protein
LRVYPLHRTRIIGNYDADAALYCEAHRLVVNTVWAKHEKPFTAVRDRLRYSSLRGGGIRRAVKLRRIA